MDADSNSESFRAKTIIMTAINKGKIEPVVKILQQLLPVDEPIQDGNITTLMLVAGKGTASDIAQILSLGPDINLTDNYGRTALHFACRSGNIETFNQLIAIEELEYDVFTHAGVTPLMMAVESRNIELVAACLRANFNPFLHDALNNTAMDYANFGREQLDNDIAVIIDQAMTQWKTQLSATELVEGQPEFSNHFQEFLK